MNLKSLLRGVASLLTDAEPSRPYSIAGEIRVIRSHFADRSKSRDQSFSIASVCVVLDF